MRGTLAAALMAHLENPVTFRAAQGVTFEGTRVNWLETHGATHVLDYAALVEPLTVDSVN